MNVNVGDVKATGLVAPRVFDFNDTLEVSFSIENVGDVTIDLFDFDFVQTFSFRTPGFSFPAESLGRIYLSEDRIVDSEDILLEQALFREDFIDSSDPFEPGESVTGTVRLLSFESFGNRDFFDNFNIEKDLFLGDKFLIFEANDGVEGDSLTVNLAEEANTSNNTIAIPIRIVDRSLIEGTVGADELVGTLQSDDIRGLDGNDTVRGRAGDDTITGDNGSDTLFGQNGDDDLFGGNGNDRLVGGNGNDSLDGNSGVDELFGDAGNDFISGGNGNDRLVGGDGSDALAGGSGSDTIIGGAGNDVIIGGSGFNLLTGGAGADDFILDRSQSADVITDFQLGVDRIGLGQDLETGEELKTEDLTIQNNTVRVGNQILATVIGLNTSEIDLLLG